MSSEAADVLEWDVPDDVSVVFVFCPSTGDLFHRAIPVLLSSGAGSCARGGVERWSRPNDDRFMLHRPRREPLVSRPPG